MALDTLFHPTLKCTLRGKPTTSTVQFRNLKYASIPGRWRDSVPNNTLPSNSDGIFDATTFGPACPHHPGAQAWDLTLVGNLSMPLGEGHAGNEQWMDELECLNLNVIVPKSALAQGKQPRRGGKGLPVFVWVHGGGLSMGSNAWPQYSLTKLVERSVAIGKPVVGVAINYRVGVLGFLASQELGIGGNFGFKDQVLAFRWVKRHIAGFGGDPGDVTAAGESAGGISLSTLLCADVGAGLFERVVVMSGEATLREPRSRAWHEMMYHDQLKFLELQETRVEERTKRMRDIGAEELVGKLPLAQHFCACIDGDFLKEEVTLTALGDGERRLHKPEWCREFIVGDTAHDGTCLKGRILDNPNAFSLLKSLCAQHLTHPETQDLLEAYSLPASSPSQESRSLLVLASELRFYLPALAVHTGWKSARPAAYCRRYHFHALNPVDGLFAGLASHELDVALLLGNFDAVLGERDRETASQMADHWINFANGEGWCAADEVVVVGDQGIKKLDKDAYDKHFRGGRGKVLERIGAERLWRIAEGWQGVRADEVGSAKARM